MFYLRMLKGSLLVSTKNRDLWPDPVSCAESFFRILSQLDLPDLPFLTPELFPYEHDEKTKGFGVENEDVREAGNTRCFCACSDSRVHQKSRLIKMGAAYGDKNGLNIFFLLVRK